MEETKSRKMRYWWFPMLFGIIFILIGFWILRSPAESFETIAKIVGVVILVSGTTQLLFSVSKRRTIPWWGVQLFNGLVDLAIGAVLILFPEVMLKIITIFVGIWLIINSVMLIKRAVDKRKSGHGTWNREMILGLLLLLMAIIFIWHPMVLGATIAIWTAIVFILLGIFRITLTLRLRPDSSSRNT
jgi:uncharacterized membrane protein HdeD (DUF308 family)